jgi:hypothetical protein
MQVVLTLTLRRYCDWLELAAIDCCKRSEPPLRCPLQLLRPHRSFHPYLCRRCRQQ